MAVKECRNTGWYIRLDFFCFGLRYISAAIQLLYCSLFWQAKHMATLKHNGKFCAIYTILCLTRLTLTYKRKKNASYDQDVYEGFSCRMPDIRPNYLACLAGYPDQP